MINNNHSQSLFPWVAMTTIVCAQPLVTLMTTQSLIDSRAPMWRTPASNSGSGGACEKGDVSTKISKKSTKQRRQAWASSDETFLCEHVGVRVRQNGQHGCTTKCYPILPHVLSACACGGNPPKSVNLEVLHLFTFPKNGGNSGSNSPCANDLIYQMPQMEKKLRSQHGTMAQYSYAQTHLVIQCTFVTKRISLPSPRNSSAV